MGQMLIISQKNGIKYRNCAFSLISKYGEFNYQVEISNFLNFDPPAMSNCVFRPKMPQMSKMLIYSQRNGIKSRNIAFRLISARVI